MPPQPGRPQVHIDMDQPFDLHIHHGGGTHVINHGVYVTNIEQTMEATMFGGNKTIVIKMQTPIYNAPFVKPKHPQIISKKG